MCIKTPIETQRVHRTRECKFDHSPFKVNLLPQRINEHVQILYVPGKINFCPAEKLRLFCEEASDEWVTIERVPSDQFEIPQSLKGRTEAKAGCHLA